MGINKAEVRDRHTDKMGKRDKEGRLLDVNMNGHKGRSQRGCFGRSGIKSHKGR